ncbi:flagellar hook-associated protein FlgL [Viridibacillus arvi]|uniref:flagellar hook-associated protein FlgL n=1 Tax=Viridibacillus arvi TaxID=263475 RepID=UPI003D2B14A9
MRITQSMLSSNMLRNLSNSYNKMGKLQQQISSGSKLTRPSDDPVAAIKGMGYRTDLGKVGQFTRNMNEVNNWLDTTDESLNQVGNAITRVQALITQAATDSNTTEDRQKIQKEIDQIREQLRDVANTKSGDKYIFSGTKTSQPLFNSNGIAGSSEVEYKSLDGNPGTGSIKFPITDFDAVAGTARDADGKAIEFDVPLMDANNEEVSIDGNGYPLFKAPTGYSNTVEVEVYNGVTLSVNQSSAHDMFQKIDNMMAKISDALASGKSGKELGDLLGGISSTEGSSTIQGLQNMVLEVRAEIGAKQNRAETMTDRLAMQKVTVTKQLSENEDVEYEEAITQLITDESIHRAALSVGSKIIQATLVDFMR